MRPAVGLSDTMPAHCAGQRKEPPLSVPTPSGDMPVANAAASPPLDPPGVTFAFQGFTVAP